MSQKPVFQTIQQRTTPQGARSNLSFNPPNPANAVVQVGQSLGRLGADLSAAQDTYDKLLMQNFEEQLNTQYKQMQNALTQSQDPKEHDTIVKNTLAQMKDSGRAYLGEKLYKRWEGNHGGNYYNALQADADGQKIALLQKLSYQTAQETVKQRAYDYGYAPQGAHAQMDEDFKAYLEVNGFTPAQKQSLQQQYNKQKTDSRLAYLLDKDPKQIAYTDKDGKVHSIMDRKEAYSDLTVEEKLAWKNKALALEKAQAKGAQANMEDLYHWAFIMAEQQPEELQNEILFFRNDPAAYQAKISDQLGKAVDAKKLAEFVNWTQSNLLDNPATTAGKQKRNNFGEAETVYKGFNIGDKNGKTRIRNKELDNTESLYSAVVNLQKGLESGQFTKSDSEKVDQYRADLTRWLGSKVQEADYAHNALWKATGEHMLQNEVAMFAKGADLSPEETAEIYLQARELARRNELDLSQKYKGEDIQKIEKVLSLARGLHYYRTYGVPLDQADAYVYDNKLAELQKQNKTQRAAYIKEVLGAAKRYQAERRNAKDANVSYDKNGNTTGMYFNKGGSL